MFTQLDTTPFKDKGKGNQVYFIPTYAATHNSWEPTKDPDIMFENFPLWILFWGIESIIKRMGKCPHIDDDWVCVIKTKAFNTPAQHYVPLSYEFVHGLGPYNTDRSDISPDDNRKWYPKWKFQKQAIENIINTGPAVCRADNTKNIQATIKYDFFFKWGGNPAPMESVYDPTTQPVTPTPSGLQLQNEITNPETDISSFLYQWDTRRDFITQSAIERIKKAQVMTNLCSQMEDKLQQTCPSSKPYKQHHKRKRPERTSGDTAPAARAAPAVQQPTSTAIPQTKTIITGPINQVFLFEPKFKNRRINPYNKFEWENELDCCKLMKRPMRSFLHDKPYYPWCVPEPIVNFDLVSKFNKGLH